MSVGTDDGWWRERWKNHQSGAVLFLIFRHGVSKNDLALSQRNLILAFSSTYMVGLGGGGGCAIFFRWEEQRIWTEAEKAQSGGCPGRRRFRTAVNPWWGSLTKGFSCIEDRKKYIPLPIHRHVHYRCICRRRSRDMQSSRRISIVLHVLLIWAPRHGNLDMGPQQQASSSESSHSRVQVGITDALLTYPREGDPSLMVFI